MPNWLKIFLQEEMRWPIQGTSCFIGIQPNSGSIFYQELITSGNFYHNMNHTADVVNQQVGLPYYICWKICFIHSLRRRNIHEDSRSNGGGTWRKIYMHQYIVTNKVYLQPPTYITLLFQIINQDYDPQGVIQANK